MTDGDPGTLGRRLDHLFKTVHPRDRGPYSLREAATLINEQAGEQVISPAYLGALRSGDKRTPSLRRLEPIAAFFGVKLEYFTDDEVAERTNAQLELLRALRDSGVQRLALRAVGLSEGSLEALIGMVDNARRLEGLPVEDQDTSSGPGE
ncbi:helix-turn-helix domain-containing protein [Actinomadura hibisca]|uniref:helix-turn-helix domain-containing protein n=1 Tax=Actinomadura hibisca TaxID=68565 RepID=UPI00082DBDBE|nr:helix-turn-helix transcriptional regulator [Actinomadura hibisca]